MSIQTGILYIVATPIGNLSDLSERAVSVLAGVDIVAAEDTRHSRPLLARCGSRARLVSLHDHNERDRAPGLVGHLLGGASIALISDAGTPLVSDPGYRLVAAAAQAGVRVSPVPGPSALVAALSVAGLPTDRFTFEGFPPSRAAARRMWFDRLVSEERTMVFYESPRRLRESMDDMSDVFGEARRAVVARELTKAFETVRRGTLADLSEWVGGDANQQRGEIVVVVEGAQDPGVASAELESRKVIGVLLRYLPVKSAVKAAAELTGLPRNALYDIAVRLKEEDAMGGPS
ncbi:MAG: 16S rRNA (cytidine(1402)-2'-O)-methyltransferase [Pseudomonadota bacterium]|nr:16S rRNA (cytidine(1402)-2'-O)-methyltransferase [Pseudomonadota bacterium]